MSSLNSGDNCACSFHRGYVSENTQDASRSHKGEWNDHCHCKSFLDYCTFSPVSERNIVESKIKISKTSSVREQSAWIPIFIADNWMDLSWIWENNNPIDNVDTSLQILTLQCLLPVFFVLGVTCFALCIFNIAHSPMIEHSCLGVSLSISYCLFETKFCIF